MTEDQPRDEQRQPRPLGEASEGDLAAVAAALLAQGDRLDALSRPITVAALIGLLLLPVFLGAPPVAAPVILGSIVLLGLVELYLAIRIGFDAALFRRLASAPEAFDPGRLDRAAPLLRVVSPATAGRPLPQRFAAAGRLLVWQGLMLATQAVVIAFGAGLAFLPVRSSG